MKSVRLLPIVIFAALALLVFKGIGLVTNGGYVLLGTNVALAEGGGSAGTAEAEVTAAAPTDPTMTDNSPTAEDTAPTLPIKESAAAEGDPAAAAHDEASNAIAAADACIPGPDGKGLTADGKPCTVASAAGETLFKDGAGDVTTLGRDSSSDSENAILERLGERRTQLDGIEQELDMRMALVEAAEKRIAERTAVLEALEARINSLVDQNKTVEEEQFKSVVAMYETMKPKDAAAILNELDMSTLLRVAKGMNPRKMAPIMAKMDPTKAKDLTANMAVDQAEPTIQITGEDLAALPQIVGQ